MVATAISTSILAAVMGGFVYIGRSSMEAANYTTLEGQARRAIQTFTRDVRMASGVEWEGPKAMTLVVPSEGTPVEVKYNFEEQAGAGTLYREMPNGTRVVLLRDVKNLEFMRYNVANGTALVARNDLETNQLQLSFRAGGLSGTNATQSATSARVSLRNRKI